MIVCLCKAVSESQVCSAICWGSKTVEQVGRACGAGTDCGSCRPTLQAMLRSASKPEHTDCVSKESEAIDSAAE